MEKQEVVDEIRTRYTLVVGMLDERARRTVAASEALALGWGGITLVARATGLARATIGLGIKEVLGLLITAPLPRLDTYAAPVAGARNWWRATQSYWSIWSNWSSRRCAAIQSRRCAGLA